MTISPIDKIFEEIFGYLPDKRGIAFESLAAIASYILEEGSVQHDSRIRGQFSETLYQLDVHHTSTRDKKTSMGEVKDYSEEGKRSWLWGTCRNLQAPCPILTQLTMACFFHQRDIHGRPENMPRLHRT